MTYMSHMAWLAEPFHEEHESITHAIFEHPVTGERILICDGGYDEAEETPTDGGFWIEVGGDMWVSSQSTTDDLGRACWEVRLPWEPDEGDMGPGMTLAELVGDMGIVGAFLILLALIQGLIAMVR